MKMHIKASQSIVFVRVICTAIAILFSNAPQAEDKFQYEVLLNPSQEVLEAEMRGYVMIYDGFENSVIEKAMTEQFGRIENMMFVRIRHTDEEGEMMVEEDGCD